MAIAGRVEWQAVLDPGVCARLAAHDPLAGLRNHATGWDRRDLRALLQLDLATYMTDDVLAKVDRMSMAHGLEVRVPLLDHRIVEFAARLPFDYKLRGGVSKALLKHAMRDLLPRETLARGKQGFGVPLERWFGGRFEGFVRDTLSPAALARRGAFDPAGVTALVARATVPSPDPRAGRQLWAVLVFELWAQAFLDRVPAQPAERPRLVARAGAAAGVGR
jgi:asparagine synthase (glutamine-hydrolysing)